MPLPDELRKAQEHLEQAGRLVAGATARYLEGRTVIRTAVVPLTRALRKIQDAQDEVFQADHLHRQIDELGPEGYPLAKSSK